MKSIINRFQQTLRGKLTLWYLVVIVGVLVTFALASSGLLWITLQEQIDHHIHIVVNEARQITKDYQKEARNELMQNLVSAQGMTVVILSPDGSPILETNSPDVAVVTEHQLQTIMSSMQLSSEEPVHFTEGNMRFAAIPVQVQAGKGIVAVGYSTSIMYATFYKMLLILAGTVILLVIPASIIGYKLLKKQLNPLESIADQAQQFARQQALSKRIKLEPTTQEIEAIKTALNHLLERLEHTFQAERDFFSDAAHTLKTPLAIIRSHVESLDISNKSKQSITRTIDHATDTIQDLLYLARLGTQKPAIKTTNISQLVTQLIDLTKTMSLDKNLIVKSQIQENIKTKTDAKRINRAFSNIFINAVQYTPPKGSISVTLKKESGSIHLTITNTSKGLTPEEPSQLFKRFYRGKNASNTKGSGLGLAITKHVIGELGGDISLKTHQNSTTVHAVLPITNLY